MTEKFKYTSIPKVREYAPRLGESAPRMELLGKQKDLIAKMHEAVDELASGSDMAKTKSKINSLISQYYVNSCDAQKMKEEKDGERR